MAVETQGDEPSRSHGVGATDAHGGGKTPAWVILLVALCAVAPFTPTLRNGFVWDDHVLIVNNPALDRPFVSCGEMVVIDGVTSPYYRPVSVLWWSLERAVLGLDAGSFHLANLVLHAIASVLVLLIAWRLLPNLAAVFAGMIFAVHPVHTQPIAFSAAGATELLPSAFFLAALWLLTVPGERAGLPGQPSPARLWGAAACYLAALFSKEMTVGLPLLAVVVLRGQGEPRKAPWRTVGRQTLPLLLATLVYGLLRVRAMYAPQVGPVVDPLQPSAWQLPSWLLAVIKALLFPYRLLPSHELRPLTAPEYLLLALTLAGLTFAVLQVGRSRHWDTSVLLGAGLLLAPLMPAAPFLPRVGVLFAERFLYLPVAGFSLLSACAFAAASERLTGRSRVVGAALLACLLVVAGSWSFLRAGDWRDDLTLFTRALERDPHNTGLLLIRARQHLNALEFAKAEQLLSRALALDPDFADAHMALAQCYYFQGRHQEAEAIFHRLSMEPSALVAVDAWFGLGLLKVQAGAADGGEKEFQQALRLNPRMVEAYVTLGDLADRRGDRGEAVRYWKEGLAVNPGSTALLDRLALPARD